MTTTLQDEGDDALVPEPVTPTTQDVFGSELEIYAQQQAVLFSDGEKSSLFEVYLRSQEELRWLRQTDRQEAQE